MNELPPLWIYLQNFDLCFSTVNRCCSINMFFYFFSVIFGIFSLATEPKSTVFNQAKKKKNNRQERKTVFFRHEQ